MKNTQACMSSLFRTTKTNYPNPLSSLTYHHCGNCYKEPTYMIAWMLRITGIVVAMDLLWAAYFITPFALGLLIVVPLFFWGAKKLKKEETSIEASGWVLGRGMDIDNP